MSDVRVRKLQEFIKQEVSQMLMRGLKDPRIGFTTITDVHVTGDLREATIYVSLFGSDKEKEDTLIALKHAAGHIRTEMQHTGEESAKAYYGVQKGWCLGQNTDIWAMTCLM